MTINNVNIKVNAYGDFSQIQTAINRLQAAATKLNQSFAGVGIPTQIIKDVNLLQRSFEQALVSTGQYTVQQVKLSDSTERLSRNLAQGKLHLSEYWNLYRSGTRGISKELNAVAEQQSRLLSRTTSFLTPMKQGYATFITDLNSTVDKTVQAQQYQKLWNTTLRDGANKLIDFGKNTQWAGRQLTVGLTLPLTIFGKRASQIFMEVDQQLTRLQKVYGTGLVAPTTQAIESIRKQVVGLSTDLAKQYGVAASQTAATAADLAATGLEGNDLIEATKQTTRLATLGELDHQQAMKATIALQRTFKLNTLQLGDAVNFLNAVENQTSTSLGDLVEGLPRAGNVVENLGGSFKDLAAMMVAMREAGVPAGEAANSIKSALASLINPSAKASEHFGKLGINLKAIVVNNRGNLLGMIKDLQAALDTVGGKDPQARIQLIEELFGKFQYNKVTTLLNNLGKAGSQTQQVFELALSTNKSLADLAERELKTLTETSSGRYKRAVEGLKADLIPIGEKFLNIASKIVNFFDGILKVLNQFGPLTNVLISVLGGAALVGPLVMITGLLGNFVGNVFKGVNYLKMFNQGLRETGSFKAALGYLRNFFEEVDVSILAGANASDRMTSALNQQKEAFAGLEMYLTRYAQSLERVVAMQTGVATGVMPAGTAGGGVVPAGLDLKKGQEFSHYVPAGTIGDVAGKKRSMLTGSYLPDEIKAINTSMNKNFVTDFRLTTMEQQKDALLKAAGTGADPAITAMIKNLNKEQLEYFFPQFEKTIQYNLRYAMAFNAAAGMGPKANAAIAKLKQSLAAAATSDEAIAAADAFYTDINEMTNKQLAVDFKNKKRSYRRMMKSGQSGALIAERMFTDIAQYEQALAAETQVLWGAISKPNNGLLKKLNIGIGQMRTRGAALAAEAAASSQRLIIATEESLISSIRALDSAAAGVAGGAGGKASKAGGLLSRIFKPSMKGFGIGLGAQIVGDLALGAYNPQEGSTGAATKSGLSTALGVGGMAAMFLAPEIAIPLALGAGLFSFLGSKNKGAGAGENPLAKQIEAQTYQSNQYGILQEMISGGMQGMTPVGTNIYSQQTQVESQIKTAKDIISQEKIKKKQNDIIIRQHEKAIQLRQKEFDEQEKAIDNAQKLNNLNQDVVRAKAGGNLIDIAMAEQARIAGQSEMARQAAKEAADAKDREVINRLSDVNTALESSINKQSQTINTLNTKLESIKTDIANGVSQGVAPVGASLLSLQRLQTAVSMGEISPENIQKAAKGGKINDTFVKKYLEDLGITNLDPAIVSQIAKMASYGYNAQQSAVQAGKLVELPGGQLVTPEVAAEYGRQHGRGSYGSSLNLGRNPNPKPTRVRGNAAGGYISGPGGPISDMIPAMLSNGEYVVRASSVAKYGTKFMDSINKGMHGFSIGGMALGSMMPSYSVPGAARYANGGSVSNMNVNITVNANTNSSGDDIARAIKREFDRISTRNQMMMTSRVVTA